MDDHDLIYEIARIWLYKGGDAEGFEMNQHRILEQIREMEWREQCGGNDYGDD
jgi:hypothetical protein